MWNPLVGPFFEDEAMRRALAATIILSVASAPVGVFLLLRRMSLVGDALSHAILPGVAVAFLVSGMAAIPMTVGATVAGLAVAVLAGFVTRYAQQREDSSFAAFYLISLALGVLIVSAKAGDLELEHVLFGNIMSLTDDSLMVIGVTSTLGLVGMAVIWRPLVAECLDPQFLRSVSRSGRWAHLTFLVLAVLSLVGAYQAMGSLLAVGLMMLPAATAQFWARRLENVILVAAGTGILSSLAGLSIAYRYALDPAPSIILVAGALYAASLLLGRRGVLLARLRPARHRTA
ncbi:MAG TPA: metal ABC transporter permease [Devosia sp.]|nr:metal ABC transporter permease [Devosia sp.]